ncbi:HAE1 family hydrophobic/amphiphilic exporter-1 [Croceifilum oryzae]|uniref:HAE1 family hydrophobic/amphiphilic exporter-1 n=1 Tax=Croceifilum oryzae TaxID=1553429 RepID=A0AAJ1TK92_9BACL|nr:efflux RND transporter permease subunit [Croceifilum oryzae]MDQ0418417.1 HAE1 family hydrophobic/amphiphilic exporter-1 [Croceifilum oryzae]
MTWFTKWAFRNKATVIVLVILILTLGGISYFTLPKEFLPSVNQPSISIVVMGQGADSKSIANQITEPIEKSMDTIKGKKNVFSTSSDGFSKIDITLDHNVDIKTAKQEMQEAVNSLTLPQGYSKPIVSQLNTDAIPLWQVGVSFPSEITREKLDKVENDIIPQFQKTSGVSSVTIYGKMHPQVVIEVDKEKLKTHQIPIQSLTGILEGKNVAVALGSEDMNGKTASIKVIGDVDGANALENLKISDRLKIKDIATVKVSSQDKNTKFITRVNGKEAIALSMYKDPSANAVETGKELKGVIDKVNKKYKSELQITTLIDFSNFILNSVNSMMKEVLLGALCATIVILLFLRNIKITLISIVSIPLSIGLTLYLLDLSGVTLNIITLSAIAVAVGRLVDDSIVVIENIYRRAEKEELSKQMIISATKEVAPAITSSTLTTIVVFLPMGLVQSMKELLLPFALTVTYSLLASLLVALIVVPLMSTGLLRHKKQHTAKQQHLFYKKMMSWFLNHKWIPLLLAFVVFIGSLMLYAFLPKGTQEASDNDISVTMTHPKTVPFDTVKKRAFEMEKWAREQPGVDQVALFLGSNPEDAKWGQVKSQNQADFLITMKDGSDSKLILKKVEEQKTKYKDAEIRTTLVSMSAASSSIIDLDLTGGDSKKLISASDLVMDTVKKIKGVESANSNLGELKPTYEIKVDPNKANPAQIAAQVHAILNPFPVGKIKVDQKETDVLVDLSTSLKSKSDLEELKVTAPSGIVPLDSIAKINVLEEPTSKLSKDGHEYVRIGVKVDSKRLNEINAEIQTKIKDLKLPKDVTFTTGGASETQTEQFTELFNVMLVSIGVVYLIMVMTFKTLRAPLAILVTLPLATIGAVGGLFVAQMSIDVGAMIGALMLIGIVVTNAIVLIDRVKQNEKHMGIRDALLEAGSTRMRPILMTAIATIFAMIPLLFAKEAMGSLVSKGLAVVVIGGLTIATVLTLIIIPVVYELLYFRKAKKQRFASK